MAEINIERKRPSVWGWLVGFVVLFVAAMVWVNWDGSPLDENEIAVVTVPGGDTGAASNRQADADAQPASATTLPAELTAFIEFVEAPAAADAGLHHEFVSDGIARLAAAVDAVADPEAARDEMLERQLETFREKANRLQKNSSSTQHANTVHEVFTAAADVMSTVQRARWPESNALRDAVADVRRSAQDVQPDAPLLDQTSRVTAYFNEAADALRLMGTASAG